MSAIKDLFDMAMLLIHGDITKRKEFFQNHVDPLYNQLTLIHKDYTAGFQEVLNILKDRSVPSANTIEFLKERRREYEVQRQLLQALATELEKPEHSRFSGELGSAVTTFCKATLEYFRASSDTAGFSWYSSYIDQVESLARLESANPWNSIGFSGDPRRDLLSTIDLDLTYKLPLAFDKVNSSYAKLKVLLI